MPVGATALPGVNFINCFAPYADCMHLTYKFYVSKNFSKVSQKLGAGRERFSIECESVYEIC